MDDNHTHFKGREFICSCGKNYLSYAALFTHIKQKHDGKAPGPIIRPRSERKRGRPRKNPSVENQCQSSQSEQAENGIFKTANINNNVYKEQEQEKTKKAAELLGCGGFIAFTAYKPQAELSSPKKLGESGKKMSKKKNSISSIEMKNSKISIQKQKQKQKKQCQTGSERAIESAQQLKAQREYLINLENGNKSQLVQFLLTLKHEKQGHTPALGLKITMKRQQLREKINQIFDKTLDSQLNEVDLDVIEVQETICLFLVQVRKCFIRFQPSKMAENSRFQCVWDCQDDQILNKKSQLNQIQQNLVVFFALFLCKYEDYLQKSQSNQILDFLPQFIIQLPGLQPQISNLSIFKCTNPLKLYIFLQNWITLKRACSNLIKIKNQKCQYQQQTDKLKEEELFEMSLNGMHQEIKLQCQNANVLKYNENGIQKLSELRQIQEEQRENFIDGISKHQRQQNQEDHQQHQVWNNFEFQVADQND